jgi:hypothetical protein
LEPELIHLLLKYFSLASGAVHDAHGRCREVSAERSAEHTSTPWLAPVELLLRNVSEDALGGGGMIVVDLLRPTKKKTTLSD